MQAKRIVVVGAGVGGLAVALRLAHRGHQVTVLEKTDQVGGRNREMRVNDCIFDAGPTLLLMLEPFRRLFADVGEDFDAAMKLTQCEPNNRVFFADGARIDATSNMARMIHNLNTFGDAKAARRYPALLGTLGSLYYEAVPRFVRRNYDSPLQLLNPTDGYSAIKHGMLGNLWKLLGDYTSDPRIQTLFSLQSMYLGLSPLEAPSVYGVLTYMEYGEGIWYPNGGMVQIPLKIASLAQAKGADIRLNTPVKTVEGNRVVLESGEVIEADAVICNADLPFAEQHLLGKDQPRKKRKYSCSAYMMYIDYEGELPDFTHHNIVLGRNFKENLDQIFHDFEIPNDPAFYACVSCLTDKTKAPSGHLNLFLLVPAPNQQHHWTAEDEAKIKERVFCRLENDFGFDQSRIRGITTFSPADWASTLNLDLGATFGLSHHFFQSVCFRPSNRSKDVKNLYYVGASTAPGNGLPMVLISAELAEQRLIQDHIIPA